MNTITDDILELIASRLAPTRPLLMAWCAVRYRLSPGTLTSTLNRLKMRGRIIRTKRGVWRATPETRQAGLGRTEGA